MLVVALGAALGLASTASAATCAGSGYLVTSAGTIQRFSTSTNAVTATLTGVGTQFADVAVSPDGRTVYAVDTAANLVRVIDTSTNTISASISGLSTPVAIAIAPDGTRAYVVNSGSDTFAAVDTTALTVTGSYPAGTSPTDAVVSADGALLYVTAGTDLTARSTTTGAVQTTFALGATASAVARSATTAYTANDTPFSISSALLSGSNANVLFSGIVGQPTAITVSPDGTRLYLGTSAVGRNSLMTA
jgi:YVTN family beta-propeller protein